MTWLGHYWDTLGTGNTYSSQAIIGQSCDYEVSALKRGVKADSVYKTATTPGSASWTTSQTDTYGYDAQLDYLTAASYGDGLANASPTWSYDAAGNRNDAVTDNLNRATSLGSTTVTNDILGNRITKGSTTCGWDILNRMTSFTSSSGVTNYVYRADGMRVSKSNSTGSTSYRYDGQMGMEDIDLAANGSVSKVTDYGIGPRGLDAMFVTQSGATSVSYPLYDAHGNMISTLNKQGVGGFAYSALRTFDAWGLVRRGVATGDPKGRYCANLGYKQDDESGHVYMRARYYEPGSGRFLNSDPSRNGNNWLVYAIDNPTCFSDASGKSAVSALTAYVIGDLIFDIAFYFCASKGVAAYAELGSIGELGVAGWALGAAALLGFAIGCAVGTLTSFVEAIGNLSYRAALNGGADKLLADIDVMKVSSLVALMAAYMEMYVWLGVDDGGA